LFLLALAHLGVKLIDERIVALGRLGGAGEVHRVLLFVGRDLILSIELGIDGVDKALGAIGELIHRLLAVALVAPLDDKATGAELLELVLVEEHGAHKLIEAVLGEQTLGVEEEEHVHVGDGYLILLLRPVADDLPVLHGVKTRLDAVVVLPDFCFNLHSDLIYNFAKLIKRHD
jgi:hypothetical protein